MYTTMYTGGDISTIRNAALIGVELSHVNTSFGNGGPGSGKERK